MSQIIDMQSFKTDVSPVDEDTQSRMELAIMLLSKEVPTSDIDDLNSFGEQVAKLRDALDDLLNDIALQQRIRGTDRHDIKTFLRRTCPLLAALYRAEAIADERIEADQCAVAKLETVHDLLVEAVEERHGGPFVNPVYPERRPMQSKAKSWRDLAGRE